jgi:hypothetical protein
MKTPPPLAFARLEIDFEGWRRPHNVFKKKAETLAELYRTIQSAPPAPIASPAYLHLIFPGLSPVTYKHTGSTWHRCSRLTVDHLAACSAAGYGSDFPA